MEPGSAGTYRKTNLISVFTNAHFKIRGDDLGFEILKLLFVSFSLLFFCI